MERRGVKKAPREYAAVKVNINGLIFSAEGDPKVVFPKFQAFLGQAFNTSIIDATEVKKLPVPKPRRKR